MNAIAIIGSGGLFPDASTVEQLWNNLLEGRRSFSNLTGEDLGAAPENFFDPRKGNLDRCYNLLGGWIRNFQFDPQGYQLDPGFLAGLDHLFQWPVYAGREALKAGGYWKMGRELTRCGLVLGSLSFPSSLSRRLLADFYSRWLEKPLTEIVNAAVQLPVFKNSTAIDPVNLQFLGHPSFLVARALGISGPCLSLDAACASSFYAIHLASLYLESGEADMMLAGAVSAADPLFVQMGFSIFQAFPGPDELSAPFDKRSAGLLAAQGAGLVVLKRLDDARRDGDPIQAIIRGCGLANDGRGEFLLVPSVRGQLLALERAYAGTPGLNPGDIDYLECHATGTPVGDRTEWETIQRFFAARGHSPLLGAVKANLGHLLTAAGMPALFKVIRSLQEGLIPATPENQGSRPAKETAQLGPNLVGKSTSWPGRKKTGRLAGLNAFGFGGTNAHLVLSPAQASISGKEKKSLQASPLAITGMALTCGNCPDLKSFQEALWSGRFAGGFLPAGHWPETPADGRPRGAFLEQFTTDALKLKLGPREAVFLQPQQSLMFSVADRAIEDSGLKREESNGANVAVIIAMESDWALHRVLARWDIHWQLRQVLHDFKIELAPERLDKLEKLLKNLAYEVGESQLSPALFTGFIGNLMASRIASSWDFTGPAFTVSAGENSVFQALETARLLLAAGDISAVLLGAVDLAGSWEAVSWRRRFHNIQTDARSPGWESEATGWIPGDGAAAIVLKREDRLAPAGEKVYASIQGVELGRDHSRKTIPAFPSAGMIEATCRRLFERSGHVPGNVGYLEIAGWGVPEADQAEMEGLTAGYGRPGADVSVGIGCSKALVGHTFAASGLISIIQAGLCLSRKRIPPSPDWEKPREICPGMGKIFHVSHQPRPWLRGPGKRLAAVSGLGQDGACAHVLLQESEEYPADSLSFSSSLPAVPRLLVVPGKNPAEINQSLDHLDQELAAGAHVDSLVQRGWSKYQQQAQHPLALALVGSHPAGLRQEIVRARAGIATAVTSGHPWKTPAGSYFTSRPLGEKAPVVFVYPGSFSVYPELGSGLLDLFPSLIKDSENWFQNPGHVLHEKLLYPRKLDWQKQNGIEPGMDPLLKDPVAQMSAGLFFSIAYTKILRSVWGVQPQMAMGYSMGECSAMWFALEAWHPRQIEDAFGCSDVFSRRLSGQLLAAAAYFRVEPAALLNEWSSFTLFASVENVLAAVRKFHPRVALTFIHHAGEVIISGWRRDCLAVTGQLGCRSVEIPVQPAVHHELARREWDALVKIHHLPLQTVPPVSFYSSITGTPLPPDSDRIARNAAEVCCRPVDFPRLVDAVYGDGGRIFIETGANSLCTRLISHVLQDRPHLAVACNQKNRRDGDALIQLLAALLSHRLPVRCERFMEKRTETPLDSRSVPVVIRLGKKNWPEIIAQSGLLPSPARGKAVVFSEDQLLQFATGRIADVFGPEYAIIDGYSRRVRLPAPPYLLVSRVTGLEAQRGEYKSSFIQTEYDIPADAWYLNAGQVPPGITVESGQCDLLLISYLGIDFENKGQRIYRLLDCTLTFHGDLPRAGDRLRYDITIDSFSHSAATVLFFFRYDCFNGDRLILKMTGGCAGFFSDEELARGQGVIFSQAEIGEKRRAGKKYFVPVVPCSRTSFTRWDLLALSEGDYAAVFGPAHATPHRNLSLRLPPEKMLMVDEITAIDPRGGAWGLGAIKAKKKLTPSDWYFPCHFSDDPVLAGSLISDGAAQLVQFYLLFLGCHRLGGSGRFQPVPGVAMKVRTRRQIIPDDAEFEYDLEVKDVGLLPRPYLVADVEVRSGGFVAVHFKNLALEIVEEGEKRDEEESGENADIPKFSDVLFSAAQIREFALGSLTRCFGADFSVYDQRQVSRTPNTYLQLTTRVLSSNGQRFRFDGSPWMISEYDLPAKPWFEPWSMNGFPPHVVLMELALQPCGIFSTYLGSTLQYPDQDLFFRNLDGEGTLNQLPDLRGRTIVNRMTLAQSISLGGTIIQAFAFELKTGNDIFYTGKASFGFFQAEALRDQKGLDGGALVLPWWRKESVSPSSLVDIQLIQDKQPSGMLDLLERLTLMTSGGKHDLGYAYGERQVQPSDWYFACHFYQDPVMPGSLGVETLLEALKILCFRKYHIAGDGHFPVKLAPGIQTSWKYRGQIPCGSGVLSVEVHIKAIRPQGKETLILADGDLWYEGKRIYEVSDLGILLDVSLTGG